jgi:hypothetical protein
MKKLLLTGLLTLAMGMAAHAVSFTYSNTGNSFIVFDGAGNFSFSPATSSLKVTSGSAINDLGEITGTYSIGTITTSAGVRTASVSGTGSFIIHDGVNTFTASLTWVNIQQSGTGSTLNTTGSANMTSITYAGSNADLLALQVKGNGANGLTFTFIPAISLTDLKGGTGSHQTSFSGTVATPDGGSTVALLGFAMAGIAGLRRTIKGFRA